MILSWNSECITFFWLQAQHPLYWDTSIHYIAQKLKFRKATPKLPCLIASQAPDIRVQRNSSLVFLAAHGESAITWWWLSPSGWKACLSQVLCQETDGSWPHDPWSHIHSTKWRDMTSLLFSGQRAIDYSLLMPPCRSQAGTRGKWQDVISASPKGKINVI